MGNVKDNQLRYQIGTMHIAISSRKLKRAIEDDADCRKRYGADMAKKIKLRMVALAAAESLADFWPPSSGPERCHELKGELAGTFCMDLKQPYRLLFRGVADESEGSPTDEKERWQMIKAIDVTSIEDTHG